MNNTSTKIACFAGICLLVAGTQSALSQGCNTGYRGSGFSDYCVPSSPSVYSSQNSYGSPSPRYSGNNYGNDYGEYYEGGAYSAQRPPVYDNSSQTQRGGQCSDCVERSSGVAYSPQQSNIESRLGYIETILAFIVNFLGLDDQLENSTSPAAPRTSRAPAPSGGT